MYRVVWVDALTGERGALRVRLRERQAVTLAACLGATFAPWYGFYVERVYDGYGPVH